MNPPEVLECGMHSLSLWVWVLCGATCVPLGGMQQCELPGAMYPLAPTLFPGGLHQVWGGYLGAGPKVCLTGLEFAPRLLAERTPRRRGLVDQTLTQCCGHFWVFFVMTSSASWACRCGMVLACGVPEGENARAGWWPCVWHHVGSI